MKGGMKKPVADRTDKRLLGTDAVSLRNSVERDHVSAIRPGARKHASTINRVIPICMRCLHSWLIMRDASAIIKLSRGRASRENEERNELASGDEAAGAVDGEPSIAVVIHNLRDR